MLKWHDVKFDEDNRIVKSQRPLVKDAVQKFLVSGINSQREQLQEFATSGDFPAPGRTAIKTFQKLPSYDLGYEQIFDVIDFTNTTDSGFKIDDVEDGLTYRKVLVGEKLKMYQMKGETVDYEFSMYGGALGWHRTLFEDRQYWRIEQNTKTFRNKYWEYLANLHYTLIEALTGVQAWANPLPATLPNTDPLYTANRDAQTFNAAAITILTNLDGKGYDGVTPLNGNFILLTPLQRLQRVREALNLMLQAYQGSVSRIPFTFTVVPTTKLTTTNVVHVILPKNKLISGIRKELTLYEEFSMMSYTDVMAAWMRRGIAIGDTEQVVKCTLT